MDYQKLHLLLRYGKEFAHHQIREKGFTDTEHMICSYIYVHENCSQEDVCKATGMDKTTVGKAVDSLEHKQYLYRRSDPQNHRRNLLSLSSEGRESIKDILSINDRWLQEVLSVLSEGERQEFLDCLDRVLEAAANVCRQRKERKE